MKIILVILVSLTLTLSSLAQNDKSTFNSSGISYHFQELNSIESPKALLVLFDGGAGLAERIATETSIPDSAIQYRYKVIGIDQTEFYVSDSIYSSIRTIINYVKLKEGINKNLFIGGFSLGGYTAVRFSEMAVEKNDSTMIPNAIFAVDPPLDHLDFINYCQRELKRECSNNDGNKLGKSEANWIMDYYYENFGDYLIDSTEYIAHSCYTDCLTDGGNGQFLVDIPINMIHELDVMWLIKERCRDLSDANSLLSSKFVNYLYNLGNIEATLTLTSNKGYRADGRRHPHSWSIAQPIPTLEWLSRYLTE